MGTYFTSDGTRISQSQAERYIRNAKSIVLEQQRAEHGYNFCTVCERNDCKPVTCMHIISVKECKESRNTEHAWDLNNIVPAGMPCHQVYDGLNLQFEKETA